MNGKTYYAAKKMTIGALILSVIPMLFFMIMYISSRNGFRLYGAARDIENAVMAVGMPIICAAGIVFVLAAAIAAAVSKKRGEIGAEKLIAADLVIMAMTAASIALVFNMQPAPLAP